MPICNCTLPYTNPKACETCLSSNGLWSTGHINYDYVVEEYNLQPIAPILDPRNFKLGRGTVSCG